MKNKKRIFFIIFTLTAITLLAYCQRDFWLPSATCPDCVQPQTHIANTISRQIASTPLNSSSYCLLCTLPDSRYKNVSDKMCDNLFDAACSQAPSSDLDDDEDNNPNDPYAVYRDMAAEKMGYKDFEDGIQQRLKEAGIEINDLVDSDTWEKFLAELAYPQGTTDYNFTAPAEELFKNSIDCSIPPQLQMGSKINAGLVKKFVDSNNKKLKKMQADLVQWHAQDLSTYVTSQLQPACNTLKYGYVDEEKNPKLSEICKNLHALNNEAVEIFRLEGTPEYEKLAQNFVKKTFIMPSYSYPPSAQMAAAQIHAKMSAQHQKIYESQNALNPYCTAHKTALMSRARNVATDYISEIYRSRTHVEGVIKSVYSNERKLTTQRIFENMRSDITSIVPQLTSDKKKQSRILDDYDKIELTWITPPIDSAYQKNSKGIDILANVSTNENSNKDLDPISLFSDPSLQFFKTKNAFYLPQSIQGRTLQNREQVQILPGYLHLAESNPYSLASILAHELGHKLGPELSQLNGHDLSPAYGDLLQCFKDRKSIYMKDNQKEEVIADYISAEVMAGELSKLPETKRRQALLAMAGTFCQSAETTHINCTQPHPANMLRVNGILAANPRIRQVIGCDKSAPKFKTCGLANVSLLEDPTTNLGTTHLPSESSDGVQ